MSILTKGPEAMRQSMIWRTDVIVTRNGQEQRIALRVIPRQQFSVQYLADSDEEVQYWKFELARNMDTTWTLPLWAEAEKITVVVTAGDNTVDADFSLMDDSLGLTFLILHPDGETHEVFTASGRTPTTATRAIGTFADDFPFGSVLIPIQLSFIRNNSGYDPLRNNAANLTADFVIRTDTDLEAKGADPLTVYNTRFVLDRPPMEEGGNKQVFSQNIARLDFGGRVQVESIQLTANINDNRAYFSEGKQDRQNWKAFLNAVRGQQKSFYAATDRHDMSVVIQPAVGGSTFVIDDAARVANGWENIDSHMQLAIQTADGDTQYKEIDPATTIDNLDGTNTVGLTTGLTATVPGSTINKVSFLELVRLGSDVIAIEHFHTHRIVTLPIRTIQE